MKLHQLLYFLEAAKQQHVGKAAKNLAISPSAISHGIAALEEELGQSLFTKQGKNIRITDQGKILVGRAKTLLLDVEKIKEDLTSEQAELQGHYRVAASHVLSSQLLAPAWMQLHRDNPKLHVEMFTMRSALVMDGVVSGEFDFGVCFCPQSHPSVQLETIYEGSLRLAVRKGHPILKLKASDRMAKIGNYPACLAKSFRGIENCESHPIFEQLGITPKVALMYDSYAVAAMTLTHSDCWSLMPDWIVEASGLRALDSNEKPSDVNISAIWPKGRVRTRVISSLIEALREGVDNRRENSLMLQ